MVSGRSASDIGVANGRRYDHWYGEPRKLNTYDVAFAVQGINFDELLAAAGASARDM